MALSFSISDESQMGLLGKDSKDIFIKMRAHTSNFRNGLGFDISPRTRCTSEQQTKQSAWKKTSHAFLWPPTIAADKNLVVSTLGRVIEGLSRSV